MIVELALRIQEMGSAFEMLDFKDALQRLYSVLSIWWNCVI